MTAILLGLLDLKENGSEVLHHCYFLQLHLQFQLTLAGGKRTYFDHSHIYASDTDRDIITGFEPTLICSVLDDTHQHLLGCWPVKTFMGVEHSAMQTLPGAGCSNSYKFLRKNHSRCLQTTSNTGSIEPFISINADCICACLVCLA